VLVRMVGARSIVEVGGSLGYSTLWLAEAARATGGRVLSLEVDAAKQAQAAENLDAAGLTEHVELRLAGADDVLPALPAPVDFVFLDHWPKSAFVRAFDQVWSKVRPGGVVVADNMLRPPIAVDDARAYMAHVRARADARLMLVDVGKGLSVAVRT
jgi:predicted O-methyltransferase YrrM